MPFSGVRINYDDFASDVGRVLTLAEPFLQDTGPLMQFQTLLENMRNSPPGAGREISIPDDRPITTIESRSYRAADQNSAVRGQLSFIWGIINCAGGKKRRTSFDLVGIASTRIRLLTETNNVVGHWQLESGDAQSPGCHFHCSVNQGSENGLFPKWLKIPRLPGLLLSPMDGLEFLLGELFQSQWEKHVSEESDARNGWANSQSIRLKRVLEWQQNEIKLKRFGTPWVSLKKAKPPIDVLTGN